MQALAERLEAAVAGVALTELSVIQFSALKTFDPPPDAAVGKVLVNVTRRGKYVIFGFAGVRLLLHLSQGGRVDVEEPPKATRPKGSVARMRFKDRPSLLIKEYGTQRKVGLWVVTSDDDGPLVKLGPEPYSKEFEELILTGDDNRRIHTILRDQRTVSGVGRGYTDDALHHAKLSPYSSLKSLSAEERERLVASLRVTLDQGLAQERKRTGGLPTKLGDHWVVHNRTGEPCPRCGEMLRRVSFESHEITYCPACQTGGKILADRRLSRILK
jgi:formamidopyrimidine-DNA glycosylase